MLKFLSYFRYRVLKQHEAESNYTNNEEEEDDSDDDDDDDDDNNYYKKWGRFPPERRYNMDQVCTILQFIISDDDVLVIKICTQQNPFLIFFLALGSIAFCRFTRLDIRRR